MNCTGRVRVARPPQEAITLFTPEGERRWVPGWDPVYPEGRVSTEAGTVFLTGDTTWVVIEVAHDRAAYARVRPGGQAGTVTVRLRPDGEGSVAHVEYRLTALSEEAAAELDAFAAGFGEYMAEWERLIADA